MYITSKLKSLALLLCLPLVSSAVMADISMTYSTQGVSGGELVISLDDLDVLWSYDFSIEIVELNGSTNVVIDDSSALFEQFPDPSLSTVVQPYAVVGNSDTYRRYTAYSFNINDIHAINGAVDLVTGIVVTFDPSDEFELKLVNHDSLNGTYLNNDYLDNNFVIDQITGATHVDGPIDLLTFSSLAQYWGDTACDGNSCI